MHKSKSVQLLATFSSEEIKRFGDFLKSPYFNKNNRVIKLFEELKKDHPEFSSNSILKKRLYTKLFKGKEYNDQIMKNLNTELFKLEREFLAHDQFGRDHFEKTVSLISNLTTRQVDQLFDKETILLETESRENSALISKLFLLLFRIEEEKFSNDIFNNKQAQATNHIIKAGEYLVLFFLKNLLRLTVNNRINEFSFNARSEINLLEAFLEQLDLQKLLDYMEKNSIEHTLNIKLMYYAMICNINVNDVNAYSKFKALLFESINLITKAEFQLLLHFLESIIAQKINSGKLEFYRDLFETFEYELKNDVYKVNKETPLTAMKFRNIYLSAIRVGKYEWAENFINEYRNELQKQERQSIVELSLAQLNFEKKDFDATLSHLQKVRTSQIYYKVDVKNLNLMALYELAHFESALSLIESFRKFLNTNTAITEQHREKNINFLSLLSGLIKSRISEDKESILRLKEKIAGTDSLANKKWLLKKLEETSK